MAKKKTSKNIPLPILILICAELLFAMYLSLSTLALAIWGDSVMGTVDSYDSRRDDTTAQENRSRTYQVGPQINFCPKCGSGVVSGACFCGKCGNRL